MMKLAALLTLLALPLHAQTLPGFDRFDLLAAHRARPVAASVWYPAGSPSYRAPLGDGPIFAPSMVLMAPAVAEGRHPLILLSHGSGGNAAGLGWLAEGLVAKGAIVLAVDHPGSTSGDSSPRRSLDLDARARDLDAALQYVLADPDFAPHIDAKRIAAIGFSLGGTPRLALQAYALTATCRRRTVPPGQRPPIAAFSPVPVQISPPPKASVPTPACPKSQAPWPSTPALAVLPPPQALPPSASRYT